MIVSSALMIWKGLMVVTGSESPIVVVLSGSMEPAFHRGDLLFLTNYEQEDIRVGEIVVFKVSWPVSVDGTGKRSLTLILKREDQVHLTSCPYWFGLGRFKNEENLLHEADFNQVILKGCSASDHSPIFRIKVSVT